MELGIRKAKISLSASDLLAVPFRGEILTVSYPAFGPDIYKNNLSAMSRQYSHSSEIPVMTFREPTTAESIAVAAYKFGELAKPQIFDKNWLQAGRIVRTSEGVFANPQRDENGKPILDLNGYEKVKDIYLGKNQAGFAPHDSFKTGTQEASEFVQGGLARVLEYTDSTKAENFIVISDPKFYKLGVRVSGFGFRVWSFDPVNEPVERVATICSDNVSDCDLLFVGGDCWSGASEGGYAFGVLRSARD